MKTHIRFCRRFIFTVVLFGTAISHVFADALVITDPAMNTGTAAINYSNRSLIEAAGATSEATLEALAGFSGIPSFAFAGNIAVTNEYIFDFTASGAPDLRLRYIGASNQFANTSVALANSTFSTSIQDSMRLGVSGINRTFTMRIDSGTYSNGVFTTNRGLSVLAFTLSIGPNTQGMPVNIKYYDSANNVLSAQTVTNLISTNATSYRYTGYQSTGAKIAYAEIVYSTAGLTTAPVVTLDDLSFVIEPVRSLIVITDPALYTGTNAIVNRSLVAAAGATSEATLEALTDFAGIHAFGFAGNIAVTNEYVFDFTTGGKPDLRLRYTGPISQYAAASSVALANSAYSTSISDAMRLGIGGINRTFIMRIDAGTCAPGEFTPDQGLDALGFTLSMGVSSVEMPVNINYYDADDNLLSAQTVSNQTVGTCYRYTGYQSSGAPIAYVEIVYSTTGLAVAPVVALDDLSFAAVPVVKPPVLKLIIIASRQVPDGCIL
jgi:hypothetical protein